MPEILRPLVVVAGAVGAPAIQATGDSNTGIYFPAADVTAITAGGVEGLRSDASGLINIGQSALTGQLGVQTTSASRRALVLKGAGSQSANILEVLDSSNALLAAVNAGGHMSINKAATSATVILNIATGNNERVDTTGNAYGVQLSVINALSGNAIGMQFNAESRYNGSGVAIVGVQGGGTVNSGAASALNSITGFQAQTPILNSGATATNVYGLRVDAQKATGVTNAYSVYAPGTSDLAAFAGQLVVGSTTAPNSGAKLFVDGAEQHKLFTVATLPSAFTTGEAWVSDALTPVVNVAVAGGGAVTAAVFAVGGTWYVSGNYH